MGHIPQEVIDQVRVQADIVDVIQSYIPLKKMGRDFKACCPFHNEKTPSFVVNQQRQWFHCFGCGKHGNVITFVMERENVDFPNAIHILARRYHIFIPEETSYSPRRSYSQAGGASEETPQTVRVNFKERLYMLHEKAQAWFARRLREAPDSPVATYLKTRELPPEIVEKFGIGASVDQWDAFMNYALREGFSLNELVDSGLIVKTDDSPPKTFDRFRNRLMFPIWNEQGRVVGFSARTIEKDFKGAKYVNSPETPVFKKGRILYALHLARQEMGKRGYAVLCEGQLDTIALHRAGVTNAVAPQGTAFTEEQAIILKRYADCLYLAFDCDGAGTKAVFRAAELALPHGFSLKVVRFPGGKDPDELLRHSGAEAVAKAVGDARDFFEFALDYLNGQNGNEPAGRAATAEAMLGFIMNLESDAAKSAYVSWLAEEMRLAASSLQHQLSRMISRRNRDPYRRVAPEEQIQRPKVQKRPPEEDLYQKALRKLLECILADEAAAEAASGKIQREMLDDSDVSRAIDDVIESKMLGEWCDAPARILDRFAEKELDRDLSELLMKEPTEPPSRKIIGKTMKDCFKVITVHYLNRQIAEKMELFRSLPPGDPQRPVLTQELLKLTRERAMASTAKNPLGPEPIKQEENDNLEF